MPATRRLVPVVLLWAAMTAHATAGELPPGGTFLDDDGNLHEGSIEAIAAVGITKGCDSLHIRFCPDMPVTRAEMAAFLLRALEHDGHLLPYRGTFDDVDPSDWYAGVVEHLADHAITRGCSADGTRFCPESPVTRAQMASFLVRAFHPPASETDAFGDDDGSDHESDIDALAASGITMGCGPGLFCPDRPVRRDEMASLLARARRLVPIPPPSYHGLVRVIDAQLQERMTYSWREGCPVPLDQLRLVEVDHWAFDGSVRRGELVVHQAHATSLVTVMRTLFALGFPIERMELVDVFGGDDLASMEANNTSAFNCREVVGQPGVWSEHAYGRAVDINPVQNPYILGETVLPSSGAAYLDRSQDEPGMIHPGAPVVEAFASIGWSWGGDWTSPKDYQHFSATGR